MSDGRACTVCACAAKIVNYRSCPYDKCKVELGFCKLHGGDDRAFGEMIAHIETHKLKPQENS